MNNRFFRYGLAIMTVIAVIGVASYAFAGWGWGRGGCPRWDDRGYGPNQSYSNLTDEEIRNYRDAQEKFWSDTDKLRQEIYSKRLELRSELAKENPDVKKASNIQKELSKLESEFDEKRLAFDIANKKNNPRFNRGWGRGSMMGYGPRGGGYCWR